MDPEIVLMQRLTEHIASFGPKTAVKVAVAMVDVLEASDSTTTEARLRAARWALGRAEENLATSTKAARAADEPEPLPAKENPAAADDFVNPSIDAEARAAAGVDRPKRKVVDAPQASGATAEGVMEQLRAGHEVANDTGDPVDDLAEQADLVGF